MNWEEHLEFLNSSTIDELNKKIEEHNCEVNSAACEAMNKIHFYLKLAKTKDEIIELITQAEDEYHTKIMSGIKYHHHKKMKENFQEKGEKAYKEDWDDVREYADKLRKEDLNASEDSNT